MLKWPEWLRRLAVPAHEARHLQVENFTLRDALREANIELLAHRRLIAGLRSGQADVTQAVQRIVGEAP